MRFRGLRGASQGYEIHRRLIVCFDPCGMLSIQRSRSNVNDRIGSASK
jgi:hypothetical protein